MKTDNFNLIEMEMPQMYFIDLWLFFCCIPEVTTGWAAVHFQESPQHLDTHAENACVLPFSACRGVLDGLFSTKQHLNNWKDLGALES